MIFVWTFRDIMAASVTAIGIVGLLVLAGAVAIAKLRDWWRGE